jgi:DNA polymerase III alpha subunit
MTDRDFVHLHLHSVFSFLDSTCRLDRLVARVAELGMPALAVTDHDGLYGAVRFYQAAKAAGIKPILGVELTTEGGHHLTLVAASKRGYGNLSRMVTAGQFRVLREARGGTARSFAGAQDDNKGVAAGQLQVLREAEAVGSGDPALQNGNGRAGGNPPSPRLRRTRTALGKGNRFRTYARKRY